MFCKQCGKPIDDGQELCEDCKVSFKSINTDNSNQDYTKTAKVNNENQNAKSKIAAGLLGIFLGHLGIHNFYLGYNGKAVAQLLMTVLSFLTFGITAIASAIWGLVEGILILTGTINTDANGEPLKS